METFLGGDCARNVPHDLVPWITKLNVKPMVYSLPTANSSAS